MTLLVLTMLVVLAAVPAVVLTKKRSVASWAIVAALTGYCIGAAVAFVIAGGRVFGFFDFEVPPIMIPPFGAIIPALWLPLGTAVLGMFLGIILRLLRRRHTTAQAFPVLPASQSQADEQPP
jgi:hypothetical protein